MRKLSRPIAFVLYVIFILVFLKINPIYQSLVPQQHTNLSQLKADTYATITPKELKYSGYDITKNGKIIGRYYYTTEDNSCYFFLLSYTNSMPDLITDQTITGKVKKSGESHTTMLDTLGTDITWSTDELFEYVSPLYMDQTNQTKKVTPIILGLLLIPFVVLLIPSKRSNKKR